MNHAPLYHWRNVRKSHGPSFTLRIDELSVRRGELLALLGPTGAGKSTLLRLCAGLDTASQGEITFDGFSLSAYGTPLSLRRRMTLVHQRPLLLTGAVQYNVEYGLRLRKLHNARQRAAAALERLGLDKLANQSAQTLSGGQAQLVALARAIVLEPEALLLDEPTANLDPASVALVEQTIRDVQRERGMTVLWATHNLFQARRIATRTALLWNGELVEVAATDDFFERPADPRTADFVQGKTVY